MEDNVNRIETANDQRKSEKGVTTVEYAVMLVLVAIAVMTATPSLSGAVKGVFQQLVTAL
jgi:Flp pilus assembly pilin Flp